MTGEPTVRAGIDRDWLAHAVRVEPVLHALAAWDVAWEPERVRVYSCGPERSPQGYLLIWLGEPAHPVVHWVGDPRITRALAEYLPPRPLTVGGSAECVAIVEAARGPVRWSFIDRLIARPTAEVPGSGDPRVRIVGAEDAPSIRDWAAHHGDAFVQGYAQFQFDPDRRFVWAAWDGSRPIGIAYASVRLPEVWVLNGIFVEERARGHGLGRALTAFGMEAARRAGAPAALNVREENLGARRVYDRLGFESVDRIAWIEAAEPPTVPRTRESDDR